MSYTKGPWVVNDFCTADGAEVAVWTSHDPHTAKSICECHFVTARESLSGEDGCSQLEAEANARLIAAAPDLLEALILLEKEMVLSGNAHSVDYGWKPAIEKTRAAIAAAEGKQ